MLSILKCLNKKGILAHFGRTLPLLNFHSILSGQKKFAALKLAALF
jgi:hypothetical protein